MTTQTHPGHRWRRYLPVLLALAIYTAFQLVLIRSVHIAQYDESIYLDVARNIRRTGLPIRSFGADGFLLLDQTPLYPYMLGGLSLFFGDKVLLLRLVTVLAGTGTILLAYSIGLRLRGPISGLVAALLLAVNPFFIVLSFFVRMEVFLCFFLLLATYLLVRWEQTDRQGFLVGAGLVIVTAVLFKVVAVFYCAAAVIYVFFRARNWHTRIIHTLWLGVPTAIGLMLWLSMALLEPERLQLRLARWSGVLGGNSPLVDPRLGIAALPWLKSIGGNVISWSMAALFIVMLIIFLSGRQKRMPIVWMLLLYLALVVGASLVMQLKEQRHVIGLIPITAVAIGLMADWESGWTWLKERPLWQGTAVAATILLLWYISPLNFPAAYENPADWWKPSMADRLYHNDAHLTPLVEIGIYLGQQSEPGEVLVIARQGPVVGYYADRPYLFLYTETFEKNMDVLEDTNFVVLDRQEFWQQTPAETEQLLQYISENFEVDYSATNDIIVYRRIIK